MTNLQKYYDPRGIYILVEIGRLDKFYFYLSRLNLISKQYDYRIVKKIFCIDYSMYDVFNTTSLKDFIYQNFGHQVGLLQK